jgi:hypothetical protein
VEVQYHVLYQAVNVAPWQRTLISTAIDLPHEHKVLKERKGNPIPLISKEVYMGMGCHSMAEYIPERLVLAPD